ncbi:hypothetical protein BCY89_27365 [Sphingobacterium siyangense]|uniref:Uncharacterized protein n=2 Tax=Sphingobacteriaceae TaxID=84566 RepID=A0A420FXS2_9SPHI|nr:hypothetical protein BCY89_27365 [Sphingobacterium siyangense]
MSCKKETLQENRINQLKERFLKNENNLTNLTKSISKSLTDKDFVKRVHESVTKARELGLDETFYLKELTLPESKKKIAKGVDHTTMLKKISNNFEGSYKINLKASLNNPDTEGPDTDMPEIEDILEANDYQIYWPYAEEWDGESTPAILIVDEFNKDEEIVPALIPIRDSNNRLIRYDTIIVNESYAMENPVWIVGENTELLYEEIPDLANGERVKDSVYFLPTPVATVTPTAPLNKISLASTGDNNVYKVDLGRFMAEKHYDPWLKGGSEFYLIFTETATNVAVSTTGDQLNTSTQINSIFVDRPRKTINKKQWVDVNKIAVSHWRPEVYKTALVIIEKDWSGLGSKEEKIPYDIPINYTENGQSKTYNLKGEIKIDKRDDYITTKTFDRNFIFSNLNKLGNSWAIYSEKGLNWTLPYTIGTSYH